MRDAAIDETTIRRALEVIDALLTSESKYLGDLEAAFEEVELRRSRSFFFRLAADENAVKLIFETVRNVTLIAAVAVVSKWQATFFDDVTSIWEFAAIMIRFVSILIVVGFLIGVNTAYFTLKSGALLPPNRWTASIVALFYSVLCVGFVHSFLQTH